MFYYAHATRSLLLLIRYKVLLCTRYAISSPTDTRCTATRHSIFRLMPLGIVLLGTDPKDVKVLLPSSSSECYAALFLFSSTLWCFPFAVFVFVAVCFLVFVLVVSAVAALVAVRVAVLAS
eukprot:3095761-Rhodomonas_salina.1